MSVDSNNLESYTETVRSKVGEASGLNATIKFAFGDNEVLYIDGKSTPNAVHNRDEAAQCTVKLSLETFGKLMNRSLEPTVAFMTGKIKVEGDMGVAMKLGKVFAG